MVVDTEPFLFFFSLSVYSAVSAMGSRGNQDLTPDAPPPFSFPPFFPLSTWVSFLTGRVGVGGFLLTVEIPGSFSFFFFCPFHQKKKKKNQGRRYSCLLPPLVFRSPIFRPLGRAKKKTRFFFFLFARFFFPSSPPLPVADGKNGQFSLPFLWVLPPFFFLFPYGLFSPLPTVCPKLGRDP